MNHDPIICRCEEITCGEIIDAVRKGAGDADAVKRMTRSGMGLCQGKTCGRLVAAIIAREKGIPVSEVGPVTWRLPVRPVPAAVIAASGVPRKADSSAPSRTHEGASIAEQDGFSG